MCTTNAIQFTLTRLLKTTHRNFLELSRLLVYLCMSWKTYKNVLFTALTEHVTTGKWHPQAERLPGTGLTAHSRDAACDGCGLATARLGPSSGSDLCQGSSPLWGECEERQGHPAACTPWARGSGT